MEDVLIRLSECVIRGKIDAACPHPQAMAGQDGAGELARKALEQGTPPARVLSEGLIAGMKVVGDRFRDGEYFLPDVLMSARAMTAAMAHLRPHFHSGGASYRGRVLVGTVEGDLHDIGKKIVAMFFEGNGWEVVDLGVDVGADQFLAAIEEHKPMAVGLSALLTTTMIGMGEITGKIKAGHPEMKVIVGGAPLSNDYAQKIGADAYFPGPQGALEFLDEIVGIGGN